MIQCASHSSRVRQLAQRLEENIRLRGLCAGDRYLTAAQAAEMLGVSVTNAHRALKLLADQDLLSRRRNSGTFVGSRGGERKASNIRTVYVLLPTDPSATLVPPDLLMEGMRSHVRETNIQFCFVPSTDGVAYVRELLSMANAAGKLAGIVALRCPREVYQLLAEVRLPVVVFGSLYPGDPVIPSIDTDARGSGRLLARYLIDRGHRRMALLTGAEGWPGDNDFFDGVSESLTAADLPPDALLMRIIPHEAVAFSATTEQLLGLANPPDAFITRGHAFAEMIAKAAARVGRTIPEDVELVFQDHATPETDRSPYVRAQPRMRFEEVAALIGRILQTLAEGRPLAEERIVLPVELCVPPGRAESRRECGFSEVDT